MANQMICDYLESKSSVVANVAFRIDSDEVSFDYSLTNGDFSSFSQGDETDNTSMLVLRRLADEVSFSTDYDTLTTTFHVKTKMTVHRNPQRVAAKSKIFS